MLNFIKDLIITSERGQFQCPLCNKIGNFILPIYHQEKTEISNITIEDFDWIDWICTETERGIKRELSKDDDIIHNNLNDDQNNSTLTTTTTTTTTTPPSTNNSSNNNNNDIDIDVDLDQYEREIIEDLR